MKSSCHGMDHDTDGPETPAPTFRRMDTWTAVANSFWMEVSMLWKEIVVGFLIAGFLMALAPIHWWQGLFISSGPPFLRLLENAIVGPLIAVLSFVCSIGNIPLAGWLWANGISFGGVLAFIYADLIVIPLILIYRKYYGGSAAAYITFILFCSMVLSGILVDLLFNSLGLVPQGPRPPSAIQDARFQWNYTTWLNLAALCVVAWFLRLRLRQKPAVTPHSVMPHGA
jgi:uncharacterized membrane protein YraQ (UPF0718 family)